MLLVMGSGERTIFEINSEHSVLLSKSRPHEKLLYQSLMALGKEKNLTPAYFDFHYTYKLFFKVSTYLINKNKK